MLWVLCAPRRVLRGPRDGRSGYASQRKAWSCSDRRAGTSPRLAVCGFQPGGLRPALDYCSPGGRNVRVSNRRTAGVGGRSLCRDRGGGAVLVASSKR